MSSGKDNLEFISTAIHTNTTTTTAATTATNIQQHYNNYYETSKYLQIWESDEMKFYKYLIFILIIIIAFCGNMLIIITIAMTKRLKNVTNYFLINMAIADALVTISCMPIHLIFWFDHTVLLDPLICKSSPFLQGTSICCAIYTLTVIAIDRYKVILQPLSGRIQKNHCLMIIVGIWCCSMLTVSPTLFVYRVGPVERGETNFTVCDELGWSSDHARKYTYTYMVLTYIIPLLILCVVYEQIFVFLWYREIPGINELPECEQIRLRKKCVRRKRLIRMLLAVVATFFLCHLPQNINNFLWYSGEAIGWTAPDYMGIIGFHAEVILYTNAAINPLVYGFLHGRIKEHCYSILKWIFCCGQKPGKHYADNTRSTRITRFTASANRHAYKYSTVSCNQLNLGHDGRPIRISSERSTSTCQQELLKELSMNGVNEVQIKETVV